MLRIKALVGLALWCLSGACDPDDDDGGRTATGSACKPKLTSCDIEDAACARSLLELTACIRDDDVPPLPKVQLQTAEEAVELLRDLTNPDLGPAVQVPRSSETFVDCCMHPRRSPWRLRLTSSSFVRFRSRNRWRGQAAGKTR